MQSFIRVQNRNGLTHEKISSANMTSHHWTGGWQADLSRLSFICRVIGFEVLCWKQTVYIFLGTKRRLPEWTTTISDATIRWNRSEGGYTLARRDAHLEKMEMTVECVWVDEMMRLTAATCFMYWTTFFRRRACTPITSSFIGCYKAKTGTKRHGSNLQEHNNIN